MFSKVKYATLQSDACFKTLLSHGAVWLLWFSGGWIEALWTLFIGVWRLGERLIGRVGFIERVWRVLGPPAAWGSLAQQGLVTSKHYRKVKHSTGATQSAGPAAPTDQTLTCVRTRTQLINKNPAWLNQPLSKSHTSRSEKLERSSLLSSTASVTCTRHKWMNEWLLLLLGRCQLSIRAIYSHRSRQL